MNRTGGLTPLLANGEPRSPTIGETRSPTIDRLRAIGGAFFDAIAQSGMAVIVTGPLADDCPTIFVNDAFSRLTGYAAGEAVGRNCRFLQCPETDPEAIAQVRQALASGGEITADLLNRRKSGETFWNRLHIAPIRDAAGNIEFFLSTQADVTYERAADTLEERVRDRTRDRDRVWTLSQDLFNVCDFDGILRAINPAWTTVLGYGEAELIGSRFADLIHPEDLADAAEHFAALTHMKSARDFDCRLRHENGTYRWINWTAIPEGDVFYSIGRDVTHRKQLEDLLRQSQKMEAVGQLTGGLAHDFNNMLMGIMGGMEIMRRRIADGKTKDLGRLIEMALSSAERAAALTHRLLAFSRRQSLDSRAFDVNALVASIEDLLRRTLGERITIVLELGVDTWTAIGDTNQLESAILNLAINARDAMPDGGRLTIGTANAHLGPDYTDAHADLAPGDYIRITVADTGVGMSPQVARRAFEPFYTTKPIGQGTGLGLSMVYGFAQQSKGHVALESRVGAGTSVALYLPRFDAGAVPEDAEPLAEAPRGAGETVLVIEDDETVRRLVVEVLGELGYAAIEARNADEAIAILKSPQGLDLMVSDVGLPGLNGRQIATIARRHRPNLQILFMTGYAADAIDRPNFLGPGMDLILKPFSMDAIAVRIRGIIER
jgi:PAS domain S-box-containing protein